MKHSLKWFKNRVGKRIYRKPYLECPGCKLAGPCAEGNFIIRDEAEAEYLHVVQHELNIDYYDKPL